jgi:hypothetical protein
VAVTLNQFLILFVCIVLWLSGCGQVESEILRPEVSGEADAVHPAPVPVTPQPMAPAFLGKSEFIERLRFEKPVTTTVVHARVQKLLANERTVPTYVWPEEPQSLIVTTATILIDEVLCGAPLSGAVDVSYVGGRIGRQWLRTSSMIQDLRPGQAYVLVLSRVDEEYFLVGGKHELFVPLPRESGKYKDFAGREITKLEILGGCR